VLGEVVGKFVEIHFLAHTGLGVGDAADEIFTCRDDALEQGFHIVFIGLAMIKGNGHTLSEDIAANGVDRVL